MKRILVFLLILAGARTAFGAGFPQVSSGTEEYWYYLKFTQGAYVVASNGDGEVCKALIPTGRDAQLWKVEGGSTTGYTFTNRLGLALYVTATSQGSEVRAASNPSSLKRFKITTRGSNYAITPFSNTAQAFNVWGGMGLRNDIKLYNTSDANAPMEFIAETDLDIQNTAVNVVPYPASVTRFRSILDLHQLMAITIPSASPSGQPPVPSASPSASPSGTGVLVGSALGSPSGTGVLVGSALGSPSGTGVLVGSADEPSLSLLAQRLSDDLQRASGITLPVTSDPVEGPSIALKLAEKELPSEAYSLSISTSGINLLASDYGGFFNGLQTLRQVMPPAIYGQPSHQNDAAVPEDSSSGQQPSWTVPCLAIEDEPAMHHRGFHLDISRHFFDKEEVKKLLDMASVYKLNRFHWHLTDDQGWRVEIPEYPRLTTVGAIRKASLTVYDPSAGIRFFDDTEYGRGCFYTLDDLREIVAYAAERNIQIIPEIDMPGHMTACIVAYPELGCNPEKKIEVMTEGGISRDILNVGRPETIDFLKCVLGHIAEVFPGQLIHLGGDECPTTAWESNADCQRLIRQEGLGGVQDIQAWLVETLGSFLRDNYGKNVVVWDELLANWKSKYSVHPVVMSWRGVDYARQAADKGFQSIVVPTRPLYFDLLQCNPDQLEIDCPYMGGYGDGSVNTVERVYNFDPRSTVSGREEFVLGTQANLWTESCTSNREAEYQYYPRLLALSEIAWLPTSKKNFLGFYSRFQQQAAVLQAKDITYAPHYFEPVELSPLEAAIAEAREILTASQPGAVGHPSQAAYDALRAALETALASLDAPSLQDASPAAGVLVGSASPLSSGTGVLVGSASPLFSGTGVLVGSADEAVSSLLAAIAAYKSAPVTLPAADRLYKIESASTYFRNRFNGSSLYVKSGALAIHYTPQTQPEEAWQFLPQEDGTFLIVNVLTGKAITLPKAADKEATALQEEGSRLSIRQATKPAGGITYVPGALNIKNGRYNLYARIAGSDLTIIASTDSALCYPGTWRIVEITDYRTWLQKLVSQAESIREQMQAQSADLLTGEALQFLTTEVIDAGNQRLEQEVVTRQDYLDIVAKYQEFNSLSILDFLDLKHYYLIRNVAYENYYAAANPNTGGVIPKTLAETDNFRWFFVKNADGTASIRNKQTGTPAYVEESADGKRIRVGSKYSWTLRQVTASDGSTGIAIVESTGNFSWFTNPRSWTYLMLKPYDQGASLWQFVQTDEEVTDDVKDVKNERVRSNVFLDLTGRRVPVPHKGIYICNGQKTVIN